MRKNFNETEKKLTIFYNFQFFPFFPFFFEFFQSYILVEATDHSSVNASGVSPALVAALGSAPAWKSSRSGFDVHRVRGEKKER